VILYIGFSLYNCLEKTTQTVWKTWKTQGISFCQICKHPVSVIVNLYSADGCDFDVSGLGSGNDYRTKWRKY